MMHLAVCFRGLEAVFPAIRLAVPAARIRGTVIVFSDCRSNSSFPAAAFTAACPVARFRDVILRIAVAAFD